MNDLTCAEHAALYTPDPPHCLPGYNPNPVHVLPDLAASGSPELLPWVIAGAVLILLGVLWVAAARKERR